MQYNVHAFEIDINTQQSYLQCPKRCGLETVVKLTESLCYFSHESLERETPDQKLRGFLVAADFSECDGTRTEARAGLSRHLLIFEEKQDRKSL